MPKLGPGASKKAKKTRVRSELHKFKVGTLRSGSKRGPQVKSRKQAIAIALSEAGMSNKGKRKKRRKSAG